MRYPISRPVKWIRCVHHAALREHLLVGLLMLVAMSNLRGESLTLSLIRIAIFTIVHCLSALEFLDSGWPPFCS
jgi:hypothetical protein